MRKKCSLLKYDSPAIDRLGIPAYNWWNEGLHGVARAGTATVFPQAIGIAAAFPKLCGFKRVFVAAGERLKVSISLDKYAFISYDENGNKVHGESFVFYCGTSQPDELSCKLNWQSPETFDLTL